MSTKQNDELLEYIYQEVREQMPHLTEEESDQLTMKVFQEADEFLPYSIHKVIAICASTVSPISSPNTQASPMSNGTPASREKSELTS